MKNFLVNYSYSWPNPENNNCYIKTINRNVFISIEESQNEYNAYQIIKEMLEYKLQEYHAKHNQKLDQINNFHEDI